MRTWRRWCCAVGVACAVAAITGGSSSEMSPKEKTQKSKAELAKRQGAIRAKVIAIQALAKIALPAPEEKIASPGVKLTGAGDAPARNLVLVATEHLASLVSTAPAVASSIGVTLQPARWVAGIDKVDNTHPDYVAATAAAFENLQYVLIVKTNRYVKPVVTGTTTYRPGTYAGEAHLYGVDSRRWGGVSFTASSAESINVGDISRSEASVQQDLATRIHDAMRRAVQKHLPDAVL